MQQIQSVYGGAYSCTKDDGSDCRGGGSSGGGSNITERREMYQRVAGHVGSAVGGVVGTATCGTGCGVIGGVIGGELAVLYVNKAYDAPKSLSHPDYPDYDREAWDPKLRK